MLNDTKGSFWLIALYIQYCASLGQQFLYILLGKYITASLAEMQPQTVLEPPILFTVHSCLPSNVVTV